METEKEFSLSLGWGVVRGKGSSSSVEEDVARCPCVQEWAGRGGGRVLAVHGWLDTCDSWARLGPALASAGCSVVAVDLPGHGTSDHLQPGLLYHDLDNVLTIHRWILRRYWVDIL